MGALSWDDLSWLRNKNSTVAEAKAFIEKHPPDAFMGEDGYKVPLQYAIYSASDEVILLFLEACPQAATVKNKDGIALQMAIEEERSEEVIMALINAHPGGASERHPLSENLPLHDAVNNKKISEGIILSLLNAYPQAAGEKMKGGKFLFEIFLKRKASDDFVREIFKVRIDGLLPLGVVLTKRSSDNIVLAVLFAYPEAAGERFSTKFDECILPLHIAYEDKHSELVKDALRREYPDAEKENPLETSHQLHKLLKNGHLEGENFTYLQNLIWGYPAALGKRGRDGRLPLHIAIDRIVPLEVIEILFEAYPQAGKEKMKDGRLPIEVIVEQKLIDGWPQEYLTGTATDLLKNDMPVSIEDGTPVEHSGSWHACISYSTETATSAVREVLHSGRNGGGFGKHIHALAETLDAKGRTALGLASKGPREVIHEYLLFCSRYKLQIGPPEYRTATSVVLRAQDLAEQADYGVIFDNADKDGNGQLDRKELNATASSIGLVSDLFLMGSGKTTTTISKAEFVAACKRQLGDGPREVVIKLMQSKDHWERECNARKDYELESKYVVSALPNIPSKTEIADAVREGKGGLGIIREKYLNLNGIEVGEHAFVMEAGDRNLLQMFYQEQPKSNAVREILRQVFKAVEHLHKEKLMHGDIKMLNVVRFRIDNGLRLIDLDASAKIVPPGGEEDSFAGAKFSSAILPPELIERIETKEKLEKFNEYWVGVDDDLDKKVAPKIYKDQGTVKGHYVVKSFRTGLDGKPVYDGLPYKLVPASESIDLWSLGVLAFTLLTGEPLIPSTRDDDCASGAAMHLLKSWGTQPQVMTELYQKIDNDPARDLVEQLLQKEPADRPRVASLLDKHPFFHPKRGDDEMKGYIREMTVRLEAMDNSLQSQTEQLEKINANIL
eukprot:scaffold9323_cov74-Skeletonema_dohrnii-CCMP3373.AAC.3